MELVVILGTVLVALIAVSGIVVVYNDIKNS